MYLRHPVPHPVAERRRHHVSRHVHINLHFDSRSVEFGGNRHRFHRCRRIVALYFNCFVGVVQAFEKVPALKAMAPTQKEPPFLVAQLLLLALFIVLGTLGVKKFRIDASVPARAQA
jgi:hypothetical protein